MFLFLREWADEVHSLMVERNTGASQRVGWVNAREKGLSNIVIFARKLTRSVFDAFWVLSAKVRTVGVLLKIMFKRLD